MIVPVTCLALAANIIGFVYATCPINQHDVYNPTPCEVYGNGIIYTNTFSKCICNNGYIFQEGTNNCVRRSSCQLKRGVCPVNQHPVERATECDVFGNGMIYTGIFTECVCNYGYVFIEGTKICIKREECHIPKTCPVNQYFVSKPTECDVFGNGRIYSKIFTDCVCSTGYVFREGTNTCVRRSDCRIIPKFETCPINQHYVSEPTECEVFGDGRIYTRILTRCVCNRGYVLRDGTNICIRKEDCKIPKTCPINQHYVTKPTECEVFGHGEIYSRTYGECVCNFGYVFKEGTNICIRKDECHLTYRTCPTNQHYVKVPTKCEVFGNGEIYTGTFAECICNYGYVFIEGTRICVKRDECKRKIPSCPKNQHYDNTVKYYNVCEDGKIKSKRTGSEKCFCNSGLIYKSNTKSCIPIEKCIPKCSNNQHYEVELREHTIFSNGQFIKKLLSGCICNSGLIYNEDLDKCSKLVDCQPKCPRDQHYEQNLRLYKVCTAGNIITMKAESTCFCNGNLIFDSLSNACISPNNCIPKCCVNKYYEPKGKTYEVCKDGKIISISGGPGCYCNKGWISDTNNTCIPRNTCIPKCYKYEYYSSIGKEYQIYGNGVIHTVRGGPGCYCINEYIYNSDIKQCVPREKCQPIHQCPSNLVFKECGPYRNPTCENIDYPGMVNPAVCKRGCFCETGLVFDDETNSCVEKEACPNSFQNLECRREDPNKVFKTCQSSSCIKTCSNPNPTVCTLDCRRGCFCREGYVLCNSGRCIPPNRC